MKQFLVWFIHLHLDFRVPEFESLCATFGYEYELGEMDPVSKTNGQQKHNRK